VGAAGRGFDEQIWDQRAQGRGGWFRAGGPGRFEERLPQWERGDDGPVYLIFFSNCLHVGNIIE
jgi:hypothetical protein